MEKRELGKSGLKVSALGLGCMGMSQSYGPGDEKESLATIDRALHLGIDFFDTADIYGDGKNEVLVGDALRAHRSKVLIATKFGNVRGADGAMSVNGRPDYVQQACEASLLRLGIETIDLYYLHRVDKKTPIEDTVGAMSRLVEQGKVRFLGLSEASAKTLRRACKVHPIAALQSEYSLWTRDVEPEILPACRELGIGFVPFSPLGRGFLTGKIHDASHFGPDDFRRGVPRFQKENLEKNLAIVKKLEALAAKKGCTATQLALAWLLAQGGDIVPIPGTKRRKYLEENAAAAEVKLAKEESAAIDAAIPAGSAAGERYNAAIMKTVDR